MIRSGWSEADFGGSIMNAWQKLAENSNKAEGNEFDHSSREEEPNNKIG